MVLIQSPLASAEQGFDDELTFMIGMVSASYTETESALEGENKTDPATGAVSSLAAGVHWKFSSSEKKSYYLTSTFPLMSGDGSSYFSMGGGVEFYLTPLGSRIGMENMGTTIKLSPKLTYFWGIETGLSFLVYLTETAKKSDLLFDIGAIGGGHYAINDKLIFKGSLAVMKGTGVSTNTITIKILMGATIYF